MSDSDHWGGGLSFVFYVETLSISQCLPITLIKFFGISLKYFEPEGKSDSKMSLLELHNAVCAHVYLDWRFTDI